MSRLSGDHLADGVRVATETRHCVMIEEYAKYHGIKTQISKC